MLDPATLALSDNDLAVGSQLWTASESDRLAREELVVLCVYVLEAEVNNGGFEQFSTNSSGDLARDTPAALDTIGASNAAEIVRKAVAEFGLAGPDPDRDARLDQVEALGEPANRRWNALDQKFYEYPDDLAALLAVYIRKHANAIRHIGPAKPDA